MYGPHVIDGRNYCKFCNRNINASNNGTGCEEHIIDMPSATERRNAVIAQMAATIYAGKALGGRDTFEAIESCARTADKLLSTIEEIELAAARA